MLLCVLSPKASTLYMYAVERQNERAFFPETLQRLRLEQCRIADALCSISHLVR